MITGFFIFNKKEKLNTIVKQEIVDEESLITKVVEQATPSVVTISIVKEASIDIFNNTNQIGTSGAQQDIGSGFIINKDGLIVTNKHVVSDLNAKYKVIVGKDQIIEVAQIYRDPINDLAILRLTQDVNGFVPVKMGDSDKIKVGGTVIAIGTALGQFRSTVTTGVISGVGRGITAGDPINGLEKLDNVIQTDAAINPGNSGGPLFNSNGEVIGVNVATSKAGQNIGFAIPINLVKESIENFKTTGEFERPYLGVTYKDVSQQTALLNNVPAGAYVSELALNSPGQKAGIQKGDIITEVDSQKLVDERTISLITIVNKKKIGDIVDIRIWRNGKEFVVKVKLEKRPV